MAGRKFSEPEYRVDDILVANKFIQREKDIL